MRLFLYIGGPFVGVFIRKDLLSEVSSRGPGFLETPMYGTPRY